MLFADDDLRVGKRRVVAERVVGIREMAVSGLSELVDAMVFDRLHREGRQFADAAEPTPHNPASHQRFLYGIFSLFRIVQIALCRVQQSLAQLSDGFLEIRNFFLVCRMLRFHFFCKDNDFFRFSHP